MPPLSQLAAALLLSPGSANLRWEQRQGASAEAPLQASLGVAFDDPAPPFGPEARAEDGRDRVLESRFAAAQRLGSWLLDASATLSTNLRYGPQPDYGYALSLTWTVPALAFGIGLFGGMGDTHALLEPPCRRQFVAPAIAIPFADGWIARAQAARPVGGGETLLRLHIGREF